MDPHEKAMNDIVGTWRLVATHSHDDSGSPMAPPYGPKPGGLVVFQADGRMMAVLCDGRPTLPETESAREYNSYCGNYTFDGTTLVTRVDVASDTSRIGGDQVRRVRFDGGRLVLNPPPRSWNGRTQHRELVWERIS
jgi:hypothetical protein